MEPTAQHKIESHMVDSYYWVWEGDINGGGGGGGGGGDINSKAM